jgi:hypothetical protein
VKIKILKFNPKKISGIVCRFQKTDYLCNPILSSGALLKATSPREVPATKKVKCFLSGSTLFDMLKKKVR